MMYQDFHNGTRSHLVQIGKQDAQEVTQALLSSYTLRISVLEQCHYRCPYCEPGATKPFLSKKQWLTLEQHADLAQAFGHFPITKIRFTGGEPLLRRDLSDLIQVWHHAMPDVHMALTTNGDKMSGQLQKLRNAGLNQLTFHLDTLREERYASLMGPGDLRSVRNQIQGSHDLFGNTKINMVVQKGLNDDELMDFIQFSKETGIQVRFIELMDTGSAPAHVQKTFISQKSILRLLREKTLVEAIARKERSDPAALFYMPSLDVTFGLIASDTEPFALIVIAYGFPRMAP